MADNITIKDASGANVVIRASELSGGAYAQHVKLASAYRSDTFTEQGNGTTVDASEHAAHSFALQVKETGTVTSWQVDLQISLDGTNWAPVLTHTKATHGDGAIVFSGPNRYPALYFRGRCEAITLGGGTNVVATIVGVS